MKFLALQNNPVGRVETKDEVCLDFQKKQKNKTQNLCKILQSKLVNFYNFTKGGREEGGGREKEPSTQGNAVLAFRKEKHRVGSTAYFSRWGSEDS